MERLIETAKQNSITIKKESQDQFYVPPSQISPIRPRTSSSSPSPAPAPAPSHTTPSMPESYSQQSLNERSQLRKFLPDLRPPFPRVSSPLQRVSQSQNDVPSSQQQPVVHRAPQARRQSATPTPAQKPSRPQLQSSKSFSQPIPASKQPSELKQASSNNLVKVKKEKDAPAHEETDQVVVDLAKKEILASAVLQPHLRGQTASQPASTITPEPASATTSQPASTTTSQPVSTTASQPASTVVSQPALTTTQTTSASASAPSRVSVPPRVAVTASSGVSARQNLPPASQTLSPAQHNLQNKSSLQSFQAPISAQPNSRNNSLQQDSQAPNSSPSSLQNKSLYQSSQPSSSAQLNLQNKFRPSVPVPPVSRSPSLSQPEETSNFVALKPAAHAECPTKVAQCSATVTSFGSGGDSNRTNESPFSAQAQRPRALTSDKSATQTTSTENSLAHSKSNGYKTGSAAPTVPATHGRISHPEKTSTTLSAGPKYPAYPRLPSLSQSFERSKIGNSPFPALNHGQSKGSPASKRSPFRVGPSVFSPEVSPTLDSDSENLLLSKQSPIRVRKQKPVPSATEKPATPYSLKSLVHTSATEIPSLVHASQNSGLEATKSKLEQAAPPTPSFDLSKSTPPVSNDEPRGHGTTETAQKNSNPTPLFSQSEAHGLTSSEVARKSSDSTPSTSQNELLGLTSPDMAQRRANLDGIDMLKKFPSRSATQVAVKRTLVQAPIQEQKRHKKHPSSDNTTVSPSPTSSQYERHSQESPSKPASPFITSRPSGIPSTLATFPSNTLPAQPAQTGISPGNVSQSAKVNSRPSSENSTLDSARKSYLHQTNLPPTNSLSDNTSTATGGTTSVSRSGMPADKTQNGKNSSTPKAGSLEPLTGAAKKTTSLPTSAPSPLESAASRVLSSARANAPELPSKSLNSTTNASSSAPSKSDFISRKVIATEVSLPVSSSSANLTPSTVILELLKEKAKMTADQALKALEARDKLDKEDQMCQRELEDLHLQQQRELEDFKRAQRRQLEDKRRDHSFTVQKLKVAAKQKEALVSLDIQAKYIQAMLHSHQSAGGNISADKLEEMVTMASKLFEV